MAFLFGKSKKQQQGLPTSGRNLTSADGSSIPTGANSVAVKDGEKPRMGGQSSMAPPMNPGMIARGATPDQMALQQQQGRNAGNPPQRPPPDMSLYPWSQRRIEFAPNQNPFPRYGAATNSLASPKGDIYLMGGLIEGLMVKGDLWTVEAGSGPYSCNPVATASEGPGPRVGHRALLVGNAFIVFGGDTKIEDNDMLDDTLYLLNTSTKHWSRALPAGQRPAGRYGHTLNILGSKIYIFGGQVEDYFFNDLVAFDLNALQQASNRWEILISNTNDGGPPQGQSPPARTNHTMVTWNDQLFLFGGTDGIHWFNDVWSYDPRTNSWTPQDCIGFIPPAREGHAAALVGDVMYVFGGRTKDGNDLGDLSAFRIPSRRWYTFQNMGPSPSPRSGHGMTAHDQFIYVLGGEPSSSPKDPSDLHMIYVLDTTKIRYPPDATQQQQQQGLNGVRGGSRRPSVTERSNTPQALDRSVSREGQYSNGLAKYQNGSQDNMPEPQQPMRGPLDNMSQGASFPMGAVPGRARIAGAGPPAGPPPGAPPPVAPNQQNPYQQQSQSSQAMQSSQMQPTQMQSQPVSQQQPQQPRMNGVGRPFATPDGRESPRNNQRGDRSAPHEPAMAPIRNAPDSGPTYGQPRHMPSRERAASPSPVTIPGQYTPPRSANTAESYTSMIPSNPDAGIPGPQRTNSIQRQQQQQQQQQPSNVRPRLNKQQESLDENDRNIATPGTENFQTPMEQPNKTLGGPSTNQPFGGPSATQPFGTQPINRATQRPIDSGLGSSPELSQKNDSLARELDSIKRKNAWYASELALARKAGYHSGSADSPTDARSPTAFADDDKPLVEALLKMRNELAAVQESFSKQQSSAAERVGQAERQRDAAIAEAVFHKTRHAGKSGAESRDIDDRESSRRLATALASQTQLQAKISALSGELEAERKARQLAEESAESAHNRATDLDTHKKESSSELERLRSELHDAERTARQEAANSAEHQNGLRMLQVDMNELNGRLATVQEEANGHRTILGTLREAVNSSSEKAITLEKQVEHERRQRESVEEKLAHLRSEHEARVSELDSTSRRLQDAEELAASHANEARTHREAVTAGFGTVLDRDLNPQAVADERVEVLQERLEAANALVRQNQEAADHAGERVRRAEERIAGLEAYQEQASREGLSMRKQLQAASREAVTMQSERSDLQEQLSSHKMEMSALLVQHNALKDLIAERGIDASNPPSANSTRSVSHENESSSRLRELESQLESYRQQHDEMRATFAQRESDANRGWEEKLKALDDDYQAAVKYLKGTEKMLSKMKQELHRYKSANKDLEDDLTRSRSSPQPPANWETERTALRAELDALQGRVQHSQQQLESQMSEARNAAAERATAQRALDDAQTAARADNEQMRAQNSALETRAREAEQKVQQLLDTVGNSVASYRRNSQNVNGVLGGGHDNDSPERGMHAPPSNSNSNGNGNGNGIGGLFNHGNPSAHSRGISSTSSLGADSNYSIPASSGIGGDGAGDGNNGRNSIALDSLASELETLRSHWETTNKNYRSSGQSFVGVAAPASSSAGGGVGGAMRSGVGVGGSGATEREGMGTPSVPGAFDSLDTESGGGQQQTERLADWRRRLDVEEREGGGGGGGRA